MLPREHDKLLLHQVGTLAQKRLARGLRLNADEARALIASVLHELVRDGKHSVAELMALGRTFLGRANVLPHVDSMLHEIQIEGAFPDGVFLVTVHEPVCRDYGDLALALYGSFLPVPSNDVFVLETPTDPAPGALVLKKEYIYLNEGKPRVTVDVTNTSDRPIQVGSHYHFAEVNRALVFNRGLALFHRLDIAAGTAVRFEPGDRKRVQLVEIGGLMRVTGGNRLINSYVPQDLDDRRLWAQEKLRVIVNKRFGHTDAVPDPLVDWPLGKLSREAYASIFGPTTGDKVQLADTDLWIEVEHDYTRYGEELKFGGGKVVREGMGQQTGLPDKDTLDLVITNALIVDWSGIVKADVGIKKGIIVGIGKAGNPDIQDGITPGMIVGANTEVAAGEGQILTAGAIDVHVHYIAPQQVDEMLASGTTTAVGGGTGPVAGTSATTCTPSSYYIEQMMQATDSLPVNFLFSGKGNDSGPAGLVDMVKSGCAALKIHEDWGATPSVIDNCLAVCDQYDVQCNIHTDTLNESGSVEDTIAAINGRVMHTYHTEGAGGGHAPDIMIVAGLPNILPSSTNPTRPYCTNTLDEHLDMLMVCHHLDKSIPEDVAFAESRIRAETVAAEDVLQDMGAISIISSDSQAMGRVGEVVSRTWRTAAKMKQFRGPLPGDSFQNDNNRVKRYVAKYTINPAITHGISHIVGDVAVGKLADLFLWKPQCFGVRPSMVIKGGFVAAANVGDPNGSIPTVEPVIWRDMWARYGNAAAQSSRLFVSQLSLTTKTIASYRLKKRAEAVKNCRNISKADLKLNDAIPSLAIDPETYKVVDTLTDTHLTVPPATKLPLSQKYYLF